LAKAAAEKTVEAAFNEVKAAAEKALAVKEEAIAKREAAEAERLAAKQAEAESTTDAERKRMQLQLLQKQDPQILMPRHLP
jgi:hypothetical protein